VFGLPELVGLYFFGALRSGRFFAIKENVDIEFSDRNTYCNIPLLHSACAIETVVFTLLPNVQ